MASFIVTNTFVANTKARSAQVNQNFTDTLNILAAHHHDPNIYTGASPITNSGIAPNAQILPTQLQYNITLSGLINPLALQTVTVPKGGLGLMSVASGDTLYGDSPNVYKTLPIGTSGQVKTVDAFGKPSWQDAPPSIFNYFGDGTDGNIDINSGSFSSGPITSNQLTRDAYFNSLTLSGGNLDTNGYKLFVKGSLTINSTFKVFIKTNNGGDGGDGTVGASGGGSAGAAGVAGNTGTVYGGLAGIIGVVGANGSFSSASPGSAGSNGNNGSAQTISLVPVAGVSGGGGGGGGTGGISAGGSSSGGSGGGTATAPVFGTPHTWLQLFRFLDPTTALWAAMAHYKTGSSSGSGGGGASAGGTVSGSSASGGGGGGSGANAGVVYIAAYAIVNNGTIQSKGGNGGKGGNGATANGSYSNAGGGGGGGPGGGGQGGLVVLIYHTTTGSGTNDVSGGSAGTVGSGGSGFSGGGTGSNGSSASGGNSGVVLSYAV